MEAIRVKRDPRREKVRDFRLHGKCSCGMCKWHKDPVNDEVRKERKQTHARIRVR